MLWKAIFEQSSNVHKPASSKMTVPESGLRVLTVPRPWSSCESPVRACTSNRVLEDSTWRRCSIVMPKILALHERRNLLQRLLRDRRHHRVACRIAHDQN